MFGKYCDCTPSRCCFAISTWSCPRRTSGLLDPAAICCASSKVSLRTPAGTADATSGTELLLEGFPSSAEPVLVLSSNLYFAAGGAPTGKGDWIWCGALSLASWAEAPRQAKNIHINRTAPRHLP